MRVLVATAIYPKPGRPDFGSFVRTQVEALRRAGLDIDVFVLDGPNRKLMYLQAVAGLRRRLARRQYDLIHAHYSYVGAVARTQARVPVLLTFHGSDLQGDVDAHGHKTVLSRTFATAGRMLGEQVDGVIVQNEQMADRLRRPDVHVIPHEVDLETFRPVERLRARAELGLDAGDPCVLFAASPSRTVKNFPLACTAVQRIQSEAPECRLIVVHREPQDRLALYMNACDVLAFPSWEEGSPNVVKQAMACNMPIVATDVGDVRQTIAETDGCHIVPHSIGAFAGGLRHELALRRRTRGRRAVEHLSCELVAARVLGAYEETVRNRSPGLRRPRPATGSPCGQEHPADGDER